MLSAGNTAPLLELKGITKRFPGVLALSDVSFSVGQSEVVALIGENGAGKSTLMKILGGVHQPDEGEICFDGKNVTIAKVADAIALGVGFVHQELNVLDNLDVAANIFYGPRTVGRRTFAVGQPAQDVARTAKPTCSALASLVSPKKLLSELSMAQQQMVEIAKALSQNARVIIMDEPTSSPHLDGNRPAAIDDQGAPHFGGERDLYFAPTRRGRADRRPGGGPAGRQERGELGAMSQHPT